MDSPIIKFPEEDPTLFNHRMVDVYRVLLILLCKRVAGKQKTDGVNELLHEMSEVREYYQLPYNTDVRTWMNVYFIEHRPDIYNQKALNHVLDKYPITWVDICYYYVLNRCPGTKSF